MIWIKPSSSRARFFLTARSRAVSSQLCLYETIDYSVSNLFHDIKLKSNIINVKTSFRDANHSAAFVSGRLLRFHITKCHQIPVTSCCLLPGSLVNTSKYATTFPNTDKRGSIYCRTCYDNAAYIISQAWLWSDCLHVDKLEQSVFNPFKVREF